MGQFGRERGKALVDGAKRTSYEYALGPTGTFIKTDSDFSEAFIVARSKGIRVHCYSVFDGRRIFLGYIHTNGEFSPNSQPV